MVIKRAAREALTEAYEEAHADEQPQNPELATQLEAAQQAAETTAKVIDPEELIEDLPTPENEKDEAMNSYDQTLNDLIQGHEGSNAEQAELGREQINRYIEAGEARRLYPVAHENLADSTNPEIQDVLRDLDRAARIEEFREWDGAELHRVISDSNEKLRQGGDRELFNEAVQTRNAALTVMRERAEADQEQRVRTKDMARAVGRFEQDGPQGYRAASAPDAELRTTRREAIDDQVRWLDSPERLNLRRDDDRGLGL